MNVTKMVPLLIRILVFGAIAYLVYRLVKLNCPIKVTISSDGILKSKGISQSEKRIICEFAKEQLLDGEIFSIKGYFSEHGRIRWVFTQGLNSSLAQKFRNLTLAEFDQR